jgi:multicomponent Na+:H+ antiporter subunit F
MTDALIVSAALILLTVAAGLARVLRGPCGVDRMMAVQLLGTGGIAALLLAASATEVAGVENVALGLALLSSFASVAFVNASRDSGEGHRQGQGTSER